MTRIIAAGALEPSTGAGALEPDAWPGGSGCPNEPISDAAAEVATWSVTTGGFDPGLGEAIAAAGAPSTPATANAPTAANRCTRFRRFSRLR